MFITVLISVLLVLLAVWGGILAWLCLKPVTLCLTFDDGLLAHYTVVAPLLEKYGWRGVFNVPTELIRPRSFIMSQDIAKDLGLVGHEDCTMTWNHIRDLIARGHEVYPHSCTHKDLPDLIERGEIAVAEYEIRESRRQITEKTGIKPRYFCEPYLKTSRFVQSLIRKYGMIPYNCNRPGFGRGQGGRMMQVLDVLAARKKEGRRHVDLMVHGILDEEGGWRPFGDVHEFSDFLDDVKAAIDSGEFTMVPYCKAHAGDWREWIPAKARRVVYKVMQSCKRQRNVI